MSFQWTQNNVLFLSSCGVHRANIAFISQLGKLARSRWLPLSCVGGSVSGSGFLARWSVPAGSAVSLRAKLCFIWGEVQVPQFHVILEIQTKELTRLFTVFISQVPRLLFLTVTALALAVSGLESNRGFRHCCSSNTKIFWKLCRTSSWVEDWEWLVEFFLGKLLLFHSVKSCLSISPSPGNCVWLMTSWFSLFPLNQWFVIYFGLVKTHSPILMTSPNHLTKLSKNEGKEPPNSKQDSWIPQAPMCVDKITDAALCPPSRLQTNDLKIELDPVSLLPCPTKCVCHEKELNFLLWLNYQLLELNIFMMVYLLPKNVLFPWHWGECFIKDYKEFALQFKKRKTVSYLVLEGLCTVSRHGLESLVSKFRTWQILVVKLWASASC